MISISGAFTIFSALNWKLYTCICACVNFRLFLQFLPWQMEQQNWLNTWFWMSLLFFFFPIPLPQVWLLITDLLPIACVLVIHIWKKKHVREIEKTLSSLSNIFPTSKYSRECFYYFGTYYANLPNYIIILDIFASVCALCSLLLTPSLTFLFFVFSPV